MRALTATGIVNCDHTLTLKVPHDIAPGPHEVVLVLQETEVGPPKQALLRFSPHPVGPAHPTCTYRREDIYGDDGR